MNGEDGQAQRLTCPLGLVCHISTIGHVRRPWIIDDSVDQGEAEMREAAQRATLNHPMRNGALRDGTSIVAPYRSRPAEALNHT